MTLPPQNQAATFEYYIRANFAGREMVYPATAPNLNQTVVVWDKTEAPKKGKI